MSMENRMQCPHCKKEIENIVVVEMAFVRWKYDPNNGFEYVDTENTDEYTGAFCPECENQIAVDWEDAIIICREEAGMQEE